MNRTDLQQLATTRLDEAQLLLLAGRFSGAYYLAGYSVECALKAVIAKKTQQYDFPDKQHVIKAHTHNLQTLVEQAGMDDERKSIGKEIQSLQSTGELWSPGQKPAATKFGPIPKPPRLYLQ